jgi:hypothetical protein
MGTVPTTARSAKRQHQSRSMMLEHPSDSISSNIRDDVDFDATMKNCFVSSRVNLFLNLEAKSLPN